MRISIDMEAADWLDLCKLHKEVMEVITPSMANDPIAYSSAARLTNEIFNQVWKKIPTHELDRIIAVRKEAKE